MRTQSVWYHRSTNKQLKSGSPGREYAFQVAHWVKNLPAMQDTQVTIPEWGRSPWGGHGNSLQYSCLENPKDKGPGQLHSIAKSQTQWKQLRTQACTSKGKESACQGRRCKRLGFDPWVGKIPWSRKWQLTPVLLPGKSHGQRSLVGHNPWGHKELDMTAHTRQIAQQGKKEASKEMSLEDSNI